MAIEVNDRGKQCCLYVDRSFDRGTNNDCVTCIVFQRRRDSNGPGTVQLQNGGFRLNKCILLRECDLEGGPITI